MSTVNEQFDLLFLERKERLLKITKGRDKEGYSCDEAGSSGSDSENFILPLFAYKPNLCVFFLIPKIKMIIIVFTLYGISSTSKADSKVRIWSVGSLLWKRPKKAE